MARLPYTPERKTYVWIDMSPQAGIEIADRRPALVLSPSSFNVATGLAWVCPISNQVKGGSFEVVVQMSDVTGAVLTDQIRAVDWLVRKMEYISHCPDDVYNEVLARVEAIIKTD
jgi:mRNA interferase MazF